MPTESTTSSFSECMATKKRGMIKSHLISYTTIQLKYLNQIILYSKHGGLCSISHIKLFEDA